MNIKQFSLKTHSELFVAHSYIFRVEYMMVFFSSNSDLFHALLIAIMYAMLYYTKPSDTITQLHSALTDL